MVCKNCGFLVEQGSNVCPNCGAKIDNNYYPQVNQIPNVEDNAQITNGYMDNNLSQTSLEVNNQVNNSNMGSNSSKKKGSKKVIIAVLSVLIIVIAVIFSFIFISKTNDKLNTILTVNNSSLKYDNSKWKLEKSDSIGSQTLTYKNYTIDFKYNTRRIIYQTLEEFLEETKKEYIKNGYSIVSDITDITINDTVWKKLEYKDSTNTYLQLFYSNYYTLYTFTYTSPSSSYKKGLEKVEKIYNTLEYNDEKDKISEQNGKEQLIGEWGWGRQGYFVIDNTNLYLYSDSSKDENNVIYGTYKAFDKIPVNGAGYIDGLFLVFTIDKCYDGGKEVDNYIYKYVFEITANEDGSYNIENTTTGATGKAKKTEKKV